VAALNRKELERLGAQARLTELQGEIAAIRRAFPGLGRGPGRQPAAESAPRRRRRSRMSAANRRAVSIRMKKYWAERRKSKSGK
jgi:hypothetical protein